MKKKKYLSEKATIWFELPYRLHLNIQESKIYKAFNGEKVRVTLSVRNDIVKYYAADFHDSKKAWEEYIEILRKGGKQKKELVLSSPIFVSESKFEEIKDKHKGPRLHGIFDKSYIEITTKLPDNILPPREMLFPFLFEWVNDIVMTYRISALPGARYAIDTISEANLKMCVIRSGKKSIIWHFSTRDHGDLTRDHFHDEYGVAERFKRLRGKISDSESTFSLAFPLFHQRRYKEALLIAFSSCESMTKELVFALANNKDLAAILWKAYRGRSDDIFKMLLPHLGAPEIAKTNKGLWERYIKARDARGLSAHDSQSKDVDEKEVQKHLQAFYELCCWLISQSRSKIKPWNLELTSKKTGAIVVQQFPI